MAKVSLTEQYLELKRYVEQRASQTKRFATVANMAGVNKEWLKKVATGHITNPNIADLERAARYYRQQERQA